MDTPCKNCKHLSRQYGQEYKWFQKMSWENIDLVRTFAKQMNEAYLILNKLQKQAITAACERLEVIARADDILDPRVFQRPVDVILRENMTCMAEAKLSKPAISKLLASFSENTFLMTGKMEFFCESYFKQLKLINDLKNKMTENPANEYKMLINQLKEEENKIREAYEQGYLEYLQKLQEDLKKGNSRCNFLKQQNSNVSDEISQEKTARNHIVEEKTRIITNLDKMIDEITKENTQLEEQIALKAEDHQAEMEKMRKKLDQLKIDKTKKE